VTDEADKPGADIVHLFGPKPDPDRCEVCGTPEVRLEGPARCMACRQEWRADAPLGTVRFECPFCGLHQGAFVGAILPQGGTQWICECGNETFMLLPTGAPQCAFCGLRADGWVNS
jgi:hypothetical protein